MTSVLDNVNSPEDLKGLSYAELDRLAFELRAQMIAVTSVRGGHLAPSLGAVELIIALHRVLDCPADTLVFDVGHQAYAHKLLTGRKERFSTLRCAGGVSGFPKITESPFDAHDSGHASDSLSVALGYALARDLDGGDATVAALIGDASFTGGMAMEALNNIGHANTRLLIVLNDNGMSISPNVGGFAAYLAKARMSRKYVTVRDQVEEAFNTSGKLGRLLMKSGNIVKESVKQFVLPGDTFLEGFGLTYIGPIDGHDIQTVETILSAAKEMNGPVVVHAVTTKGKGYAPAEKSPSTFHGIGPFDITTGASSGPAGKSPSWTSVFSDELCEIAAADERIVAITAAMPAGTGLAAFSRKYPERFFDVGIAEEHAVTMASSLAQAGKVPVVAIYSTFMQRAYDQLMVNIGLQNLHVVLCLDRAGLVGADGPTHHGQFDLSYLRTIPNMKVLAPSSAEELAAALRYAVACEGPVAVRYPRGTAREGDAVAEDFAQGRAVKLREGADAALLSAGPLVGVALEAAEALAEHGVHASVHDARWVKPLDDAMVRDAAATGRIYTLEDGQLIGGFGSAVLESLADQGLAARVRRLGLPDAFVGQGEISELHASLGLDSASVTRLVLDDFGSRA